MSTLRLELKSSTVDGVCAVVDILFNGTVLESGRQLTTEPANLEYTTVVALDQPNALTINVLNDQARDNNGNGDFTDLGDETMRAILTRLEYSVDNLTYNTVIPQGKVEQTITAGIYAGNTVIFRDQIDSLESYGQGWDFKFDNQGLMNNLTDLNYYRGYNIKEVAGVYYDAEGNIIPD